MEKPKKKWMGSAPVCDFCGEWVSGSTFVDGQTKMGPWALMCEKCFAKFGVGVGPGSGQRFDSDTKEKVAG